MAQANTQIEYWNEGATMPLVVPVEVTCNTSDQLLFQNIYTNSRRPGKWLKTSPAHGGVAVICGSGPSLADTLADVEMLSALGGRVFALNGAAKFLADRRVLADYQVIADAREKTAKLVGPAGKHLFASQVHPACFERQPDAQLWHLQIGDIEDQFPDYDDGYCLIGGTVSVGNAAVCLAYAMGYRTMHLFGYDSSHKNGAGHAFSQPMNADDPVCRVRFQGKEYLASLTMKLQAERFQETARALKDAGCVLQVHGDGLLPAMFNAPKLTENEKYAEMWRHPAYRAISPGEQVAWTFVDVCNPQGRVIDFGCGTGRGGLAIERMTECEVTLVDFTTNSRDREALDLPFVQADLSLPIGITGHWGFCTDVMEHIPPELVAQTVQNIMACVPQAFFQISLVPDSLGSLIGQPLHLSVHPFEWWADLFASLGFVVKWSDNQGETALFHISTT